MYSSMLNAGPIGPVGSVGTAAQQLGAIQPSNFFALQAAQGGNQFPMFAQQSAPMGQSAQQMLEQQPNLSPGMLGGMQNAGVMTDRLGNRIFAPVAGFSEGGEVQDDVEQQEEQMHGEARRMMERMQARTRSGGGGAETPKNLTMTFAPIPEMMQQQKSQPMTAKAELIALARQLEMKKKAYQESAKGLQKDMFGAATLEQPALTKDKLAVKRFAKGGAARNA
jgi:hypothetical protein